jgi:c-di-GMP-binding flagellar brake protein YcgR
VRERRTSVRRSLKWQATIKGNDSSGASFGEEGVIENLSSTGAFLYLNREVALGSRIDLTIRLPFQKENWMKYSALVVRIENISQKTGVGIKFDSIRPTFVSG